MLTNKDKQKPYKFFVVPRNGPALLYMSGIEVLDLLTINCNAILTVINRVNEEKAERVGATQDAGCYRTQVQLCNTDSNSNIDTNTMVNNSNSYIIYFLPGLNEGDERRVSTKITKQVHNKFTYVLLE